MPELETQDGTDSGADERDPLESIVDKYEKADAEAGRNQADEEDGLDDEESDDSDDADAEEEEAGDDDAEDTADSDADTEEDSDEDSDSTDDASDEDDDEDTGDEDEESDDAESDDDESEDDEEPEGEDDEDDDDLSDTTKAALEANGADLTLDDIKDPTARKVVESKFKKVDAALTRSIMRKHRELTEQYGAEDRYRTENPHLFIVELIEKDPTLLDRVNKELTRIDPEAEGNDETSVKDAKAMLKERIEKHRSDAKKAVDAQLSEYDNRVKRTDEMEAYSRKAASKAGIPFTRSLERAIAAAIVLKPEADQAKGLSNQEIDEIVKDFAGDHLRSVRAHRREATKEAVKAKTDQRNAPKPSVRPPKGTKSPGAAKPKPEPVDHNDQDSRVARMLKSARKIKPGVRDR